MNPQSDKTLFERFLDWWRGLFGAPTRRERPGSDTRNLASRDEQQGVLGDLPDSGRPSYPASRSDSADQDTAPVHGTTANRSTTDAAVASERDSADIERQDNAPSATGASDDEFQAGGYSAGLTDQEDVEEAAERDTGDVPSDDPGSTGSYRSMTGGNVPPDDSGWTVGGSTSAAEDSGSLASRGAGIDDPGTIETDHAQPGQTAMPAAGGAPDRTGPSGVNDFDDASGASDAGTEPADGVANDASAATGEAGAVDYTQQSADAQAAALDRSMQGDTDYVTAGYPSESMDIDITDTDDVGVEDAESDQIDEDAGDDAAEFSEDVGELGLADSETVDDGVPDSESDEASSTPASSEDIGVGTAAEVDDTSVITTGDNAIVDEAHGENTDVGDENTGESEGAAGAGTTAQPEAGSAGAAGRVRGDGTTNTPDGYPIKGNASSKIYHMPGMPSYEGTKAEWCFATEEDAIAAGYRAPAGRNHGRGGGAAVPDAGATAQKGGTTSEGIQAFASTADRDVLSDMQDSITDESESDPEPALGEFGGLGSDASSADDPTSVGITAPEASASGKPARGNGGEIANTSGSVGAVAESMDADGLETSSNAAFFDEATDPAQSAATEVSSMQTDTIGHPAGDAGVPVESDAPERVGAARTGESQGYAGAVPGDGTKSCPADYPIKGNAGSMIYHTPGRASYDNTIPEWCFATEEDAVNAGFRAPKR